MTMLIRFPSFYGSDVQGAAPAGFQTRGEAIPMVPGQRGLTKDGQSINEIWNELQERNSAFNQTMDRLIALMTFQVDRAQDRVAVPSHNGFEEATEYGRPVKRRYEFVFRGFPLRHVDTGVGYSQEYLDSASAREVTALADDIEVDWTRENFLETFNAIFNNVNANDLEGVSVKRLFNGDGEVPPRWKATTFAGTHDHYLTSAALDVAALNAAEVEITHHGYDGQLFTLANKADVDTIRGLTGFVPAVSADRATIVNGDIIGGTRPTGLDGLPVQGYFGKFAIVQEDEMPAGYLLHFATSGILSPRNVIGLRVHENASARGLRLVSGPKQDYPLYDAYWDGYLGAGVRQRGAAAVTQITGGAYTPPTLS